MAVENKEKSTKVIIIIAGIIFAIFILTAVLMGFRGFLKIISTGMIILFAGGIVFASVYLFWYLFLKKHKFDVTYVNKQKLIEAGKLIGKSNLMGNLTLSGDSKHSMITLGKIIGYCRIQVLTRTNKLDSKGEIIFRTKDDGTKEPEYILGKEEQDIFIVKKGVFAEPMVVRVSPEDHDDLVGDVVLKGFSLIPHSEYWFLNSDHLDVRKIDFAILKEAQRGIMFEMLRDQKEVVDRAVGLDARHKKDIENKNLYESSNLGGQA